jgi:glutamyl-tRNA reductase
VLEALARGLTNKLLHPSLAALNAAGEAERTELIALFSRIYGFSEPSEPGSEP